MSIPPPNRARVAAPQPARTLPPDPTRRRPGLVSLLAWLLLPAVLAIVLAILLMNSSTAGQPPAGAAAADGATATAALVAVAPSSTPLPPTPVPPTATTAPPDTATPRPTDTPPPSPTVAPSATPAPPPTVTVAASPTAPPVPTVPVVTGPIDPITGMPADSATLKRPPLVVMIDNHPDAAPQTGLNAADLVIEALAEGGITRFETFFQSGSAPVVGPIRSARPYFVEWAYPFQPLYVHCGGSWEAIDLIGEASGTLNDVDCFNGNMPFWRSNDRLMPHNLYSSTTDLWKLAAARGLKPPAQPPSFPHSPALPPAQRPASASVSFTFSGLSPSNVTWVFDPASDTYRRKQWGAWHRDLATGDIVNASNVVILWTNVWALPGDTAGRLGTDTVGQGTALILRDGQVAWGYWARANTHAPLTLLDGKHEPAPLAPGRTWIEVLGIGKKVQLGN